jgi:hypothetical protein
MSRSGSLGRLTGSLRSGSSTLDTVAEGPTLPPVAVAVANGVAEPPLQNGRRYIGVHSTVEDTVHGVCLAPPIGPIKTGAVEDPTHNGASALSLKAASTENSTHHEQLL